MASNLAANHVPDGHSTEAGKGELNHAATWDDFPNGRFGDFKSPAFGELNPWGTSTISVNVGSYVMCVAADDVFLYLHV